LTRITLLKKSTAVLPLKTGTKIAAIGKPAAQFRSGIGSAYVKPISAVTPLQGLTARGGATNVRYADGSDVATAVKAAKAAKVAIVFVSDARAESTDVSCLTLECGDSKLGDQDALVRSVAAANPNTVVVLETGGPTGTTRFPDSSRKPSRSSAGAKISSARSPASSMSSRSRPSANSPPVR
jgi:beta-glucosidase